MAQIISIETSTKVCSIALHTAGELVASQVYHLEKSHSALLPSIVDQLLTNCDKTLAEVDAFAVSAGPGSYTGLRIGVTSAKGLAFATDKPLIGVETLEAMALQMANKASEPAYFCPMIDARRMEVYCLLSDGAETVKPVAPLIVEESSFEAYQDRPLYLFGDGAAKTKEVLSQANLRWVPDLHPSAVEVGVLAYQKYLDSSFEDIAYFEPFYLKEFQTKPAKKLV